MIKGINVEKNIMLYIHIFFNEILFCLKILSVSLYYITV